MIVFVATFYRLSYIAEIIISNMTETDWHIYMSLFFLTVYQLVGRQGDLGCLYACYMEHNLYVPRLDLHAITGADIHTF